MTDMRYILEAGMDRTSSQTRDQQEVLRRAVAKVVVMGEQVGVSTEQMIQLLEGGLSVRELLEYLLSRNTNLA
jgi:hypothetical protein